MPLQCRGIGVGVDVGRDVLEPRCAAGGCSGSQLWLTDLGSGAGYISPRHGVAPLAASTRLLRAAIDLAATEGVRAGHDAC